MLPVSASPPDTSGRIDFPPDTGLLHSTDVSFATVPSASSSTVPPTTPVTGGSRRGSPTQTPAMPSVIEFNGYDDSEFSGLLHYSLHSVLYEDRSYPTALHLIEAWKFLPHRPDLAERIRQCERVEQLNSIIVGPEFADFKRRDSDWDQFGIVLSLVSKAFLYLAPRLGRGWC